MPGKLYRAVKRTGGVAPIVSALKSIFEAKEKKDYYNNLLNVWNRTQENMSGTNDITSEEITPPQNALSLPKELPNVGTLQAAEDRNRSTSAPMTEYSLGDYIPANIKDPATGQSVLNPERYERGQKELSNFQGTILQEILSPNADKDKIAKLNALGNLLSSQVQASKPPEPEYFNLGPDQIRYKKEPGKEPVEVARGRGKADKEIDSFTNSEGKRVTVFQKADGSTYEQVSENKVYKEPKNDKEIDSYTGDDGYRYSVMQKPDGSTYERKSKKKIKSSKDFKLPSSVNNAIDELKNPELYKDYSSTGYSQVKKAAHDKVKRGLLTPNAMQYITNVESGEGYITPKEIDEIIERGEALDALSEEDVKSLEIYKSYYSDYYKNLIK